MDQFSTPMMKQYQKIKEQYPDCLLFYRMGDFYELFLEDAYIGAKILDITLTGKSNGKNGRIPMAGVPYHAVDNYLHKLVKAGYKVAICEQLSPPNKYGLVERDVIRIVTPGTVLDEKVLGKKENNYIISLLIEGNNLAISAADISTGYLQTLEITTNTPQQTIHDELSRIKPSECILSPELYNNAEILKMLHAENGLNIYCFLDWDTFAGKANQFLKKHFSISSLAGFGIDDKPLCQQTAAALLGYLKHTQQGTVGHIKKILFVTPQHYMQMDRATMINLELFSTIREHDTHGSLLRVLDQTVTAMGGRMLKEWLRKPLVYKEAIMKRHEAIEALLANTTDKNTIVEILKTIADIERMLSRLSVGIGNARDLINLRESLQSVLSAKAVLMNIQSPLIKELAKDIVKEIQIIIDTITTNIKEEPGIDLRNGNIIKIGVNKELDTLRKRVNHSKEWIVDLEKTERQRSGISSLKVRYNKVFGFYIEISKPNLPLIPDNYIRKQTLVNGERFITQELKEQEEVILTAEQRIFDLEYELFQNILARILEHTEAMQKAAHAIGVIDCLVSFAQIAEKNNYTRPILLDSEEIYIEQGRHPVVEKLLAPDYQFVPNDVQLDTNNQLLLITGPNMAGKSVFIRQVSLIVLMCQIGSFVPATIARLGVVDRIFVRSGASDVITSGLSTFMVEMVETAHILHHATSNSLIVMDEIGRGTSTYDGISIAWAVAEYLVANKTVKPKTLFATHYHELQALEQEYSSSIKNFHMAVIEENNQPVFLHTIKQGGASSSFGVAVAKLAGIPDPIITKANEMLKELEERTNHEGIKGRKSTKSIKGTASQSETKPTFDTFDTSTQKETIHPNLVEHIITKELSDIDIHQLTPLEALNKLAELKDKLKIMQTTEQEFLKVD